MKPIRLCAFAAVIAFASAAVAKPHGPLPMKTKWTFSTNSGQYGSVVVADLRGDGQMQVVVPSRRDGQIHCLDAQGRSLWRVSLPPRRGASAAPAVGDVDLDGRREVAIGIEGGGIMLLDAEGKQRWHLRLPASVAFSMPVIADIVGDEKKEIIVPTIGDGVWCVDWEGKPVWVHHMSPGIYSPAAVGDVDLDGHKEVLFGAKDGAMRCLGYDGREKWRFQTGADCYGGPVIADLDADGEREILLGSDDFNLYCINGKTGKAKWAYKCRTGVGATIAVADLDADGDLEVVCRDACGGGKPRDEQWIYCVDKDGGLLWKSLILRGHIGESASHRAPVIGDVNDDGKPEIVFGNSDTNIYCYSAQGEFLWRFPTQPFVVANGRDGMTCSPTLCDIDGDGLLDIVTGSKNGRTYCFSTDTPYLPERILWPMARYNTQQQAACVPEAPEGVLPPARLPDYRIYASQRPFARSEPPLRVSFLNEGTYPSLTHLAAVTCLIEAREDQPAACRLEVRQGTQVLEQREEPLAFEHGTASFRIGYAAWEPGTEYAVIATALDDKGEPIGAASLTVSQVGCDGIVAQLRILRERIAEVVTLLDERRKAGADVSREADALRYIQKYAEYTQTEARCDEPTRVLRNAEQLVGDATRLAKMLRGEETDPPIAMEKPDEGLGPVLPADHVRVRDDGVLEVAGKPVIPVGLYGVTAEDLPTLAEAGLTLVFQGGGSPEFSALCREHGLLALGSGVHDVAEYGRFPYQRAMLERLRRDPQAVGTYVVDEPDYGYDPARTVRAIEITRMVAPEVPALVLVGFPAETGWEYVSDCDIAATDPYYLVDGLPLTKVSDFIDALRVGTFDRAPVWAVLQAYSMSAGNPLPSPAEGRCMSWLSIIHGARGIGYFSWRTSYQNPKKTETIAEISPGLWREISRFAKEVKALTPVLTTGDDRLAVIEHADGGRVDWLLKTLEDEVYVFACNPTPVPAIGAFSLGGAAGKTAQVLYEDRAIDVSAGAFSDRFDAYGVHIYRIGK